MEERADDDLYREAGQVPVYSHDCIAESCVVVSWTGGERGGVGGSGALGGRSTSPLLTTGLSARGRHDTYPKLGIRGSPTAAYKIYDASQSSVSVSCLRLLLSVLQH